MVSLFVDPESANEVFAHVHMYHYLRRICQNLNHFADSDEPPQSVPYWLTEVFNLPVPPDSVKSGIDGRRDWVVTQLETMEFPEPPQAGLLWENITLLS